MRKKYLTVSSALFSLVSFSGLAQETNPLNVVLITADDLNYSSVGYMGCPIPETTPNLDRLASEGIIFNNAFVNIAVSQPSRAVLATGLYSHKNGVEGFYHTQKQIPTVMSVLREHGYKTGIAGKLGHSTPVASFQWDMQVDQPDLGAGRDPKRYYEVFNQFVKDSKESNKPFYFMVNSHDPHAPFHGSEQFLLAALSMENRLPRSWKDRKFPEGTGFIPNFMKHPEEIVIRCLRFMMHNTVTYIMPGRMEVLFSGIVHGPGWHLNQ